MDAWPAHRNRSGHNNDWPGSVMGSHILAEQSTWTSACRRWRGPPYHNKVCVPTGFFECSATLLESCVLCVCFILIQPTQQHVHMYAVLHTHSRIHLCVASVLKECDSETSKMTYVLLLAVGMAPHMTTVSCGSLTTPWAAWSSGMILASGARGHGFDSHSGPVFSTHAVARPGSLVHVLSVLW